jgi:hypothetical protein
MPLLAPFPRRCAGSKTALTLIWKFDYYFSELPLRCAEVLFSGGSAHVVGRHSGPDSGANS